MKKQFYRVKQLADQTFSRSGKGEALTDELQTADRKVEHLRNALQLVSKRLSTGAGSTQGQDPAAREKRLKKLPEYMLGLAMCEASNFDDEDSSVLKYILYECGKTEKFLANEIAEHELKVEQLVCAPLSAIHEQDLPAIMKAKKQLSRLISEKESAASRYNHYLERQKEENPTKLIAAKDELEEAGNKVESARDALAADMFALVAKEAQLAHTLLQYVKLQRAYHESALHSLQDTVPELERFINDSSVKPVFGYPLEEHLRVAGRTIAFPIELCVCTLHELALNEEGLFRIAGGSSKVRRMKLSLDAGLFAVPLPAVYRDAHVVAAVLKSYLRELPEPLLTYRLYDAFMSAARQPADQARLNALWEAIHLLPDANFQNLRYLIKFLSTLTQNQNTNKMTPSNLAIVIAPNLLWAADETTFDMHLTAALNCVVELLIKHADWFFKDELDFFVSFTREELLPNHCDYGFTASFTQGFHQTAALEHANGDCGAMAKSMCDYGGRHSRSNSHDTSLILLEHGMKKAQSNSSLSDHSSPPHGSPKPITRRKNKPLAPVPPNFTPDKSKHADPDRPPPVRLEERPGRPEERPVRPEERPVRPEERPVRLEERPVRSEERPARPEEKPARPEERPARPEERPVRSEERPARPEERPARLEERPGKPDEKPAKPPRPVLSDSGKVISGVQTINRSTYRQQRAAKEERAGREHAADARRQSLELDDDKMEALKAAEARGDTLVVRSVTAHSALVGRLKVVGEGARTPPRPVAAPRTVLPAPDPDDVTLRHKPVVPERPATLRPHSFRAARASLEGGEAAPTVLERTHVYSVDKHHPTVIQVGAADEGPRATVQRTHSSGGKDAELEEPKLTVASRQLSQSEGSITEAPSPRAPAARPPRPLVPAPPPPPLRESTDL